jgi:hypothetical protein
MYSPRHPRRPRKRVQRASDMRDIEDNMEHMLLDFFDLVVCHGFKSVVACVLVGEVGVNFYTVLDEAS